MNQNLPPDFSESAKLKQLTSDAQISRDFINCSEIETITIMYSGRREKAIVNGVLKWDQRSVVQIPIGELMKFFQSYADRCYYERLKMQVGNKDR